MRFRQVFILLIIISLTLGLSLAYTGFYTDSTGGGGGSGDTGGGETGGDTDPGGNNGGDNGGGSEGQPGTCYDGNDNDQYNGADAEDEFSCVQPNGSDHIEGSIWDTDLTTTMDGESPSISRTPSVFFSGSVEQGNDNNAVSDEDSGTLTEYYVRALQSESDGYYGYGMPGSDGYSFASGTVFESGRAIDPPNPSGSQNCGDGYENDGDPSFSQVMSNVLQDQDSQTIECRADYGRILYEVQHESEYKQDDLTCRPDDGCSTSTDEGSKCTPCSANVYGCNDYSQDDGNDYWVRDGSQGMREVTCRDNGDYITKETNTCSDSWSTGPSPDDRASCGPKTVGDTGGNDREWVRYTDDYNCNLENVVDGGGDDGGKESGDMSGEYPNKPDNDPAGTFTNFKSYTNNDRSTDGVIWCQAESSLTVDADGPEGNGDGFVVVHRGEIVATESPDGSDNVGRAYYGRDGAYGNTQRYLSRISSYCPGEKTTCLKYADYQTKTNDGGDNSWSVSEAVQLTSSETYTADDSYSVCKKINMINENNGDGTELIDCDYERGSVGSEDISPLPEVGGDEYNEHLIIMEGPAVDNSVTREYLAFEQKVVDWDEDTGVYGDNLDSSACVIKGKAVSEGTVVPIQTYNAVEDSFEMGTPSPDWEVCLDIEDGTGDDEPWDNKDNDLGAEDFGGEWYDLDDERVNDYISGEGNNLVTNGDPNDVNDVAYYYRTNPNPSHSDYNPAGGESGLALEDDCDPALDGCDTTGSTIQGESGGLFYGTFTDFTRDEDYHPQMENAQPPYGMEPLLEGRLKKIKEDSNQLEPGMDTEYSLDFNDKSSYWVDSRGGEDYADQYGYVDQRSDAISNRGNSRNPDTNQDYTPGRTYVRTSAATRDNINADTVEKTQKVFANSIVVESTSSGPFQTGEGYWLDPDDLRVKNSDYESDWWDLVRFNIDLTGPDSGLGWDDGSDHLVKDYDTKQGSSVIRGGIYWQEEDTGGSEHHERPICGDDQLEFLVEEMGESVNPAKNDGRYACLDSKDRCVTFASDDPVTDINEYKQAGEPDEDLGRLKNDREYCMKDRSDEQPKFWDQDYGDVNGDGTQDTCNVNNLYGSESIRWIDESYVKTNPHAVTGGIDDDWNEYLEQQNGLGRETRYISEPNQDSWNFNAESPVPSGARAVGNESIATQGFCAGDDEGEFFVTQQCNTNLCETDREVVGVSKNPGSCVIDEDKIAYDLDVDERTIFEPGSEVEVDLGSETRTMTCFNNYWFDEYPVVFNQDDIQVPFGESSTVSFHLINVRDSSTSFEVEMIDPLTDNPSAYQHSTFLGQSGDSFETTIGPQSSKTYNINIEGSNRAIGDSSTASEDDLTVRASAVNSDMRGEDFTTVEVVENNASNTSVGRSEPQSVPGVGPVHLIAMIVISSAVFFLQS